MLTTGHAVFLLVPNASNNRDLHSGTVLQTLPGGFEATFDEALRPAVGLDVNVYAESRGKFHQQGARVKEIRIDAPAPVFVFDLVGEAISAEQRQMFRVSTVTTGVVARIGREERCPVLDISPEGFGAIVSTSYAVGATAPVLIRYWSEEISTVMRVQTVSARPDRTYRCGFFSPEKNCPARRAMQKISASIQRTQLSRLAGAA